MANNCRSCKRAIAPGQTICHVCGAQQSFFQYYLRSGVIILVIVSIVSGIGYWYFKRSVELIEANRVQAVVLNTAAARATVEELENQLQAMTIKMQQTEAEIDKMKAESLQGQGEVVQFQQQLQEIQNRADEAEKRASWLSRVNKQLKDQVDDLTAQLAAKSTSNTTPQVEKLSIDGLKQQLANYENEKQLLTQNIESKRSQLEQGWRESDGSNNPSNDLIAARAQQLNESTREEQAKIQSLTIRIESLKSQLRLAEATKE